MAAAALPALAGPFMAGFSGAAGAAAGATVGALGATGMGAAGMGAAGAGAAGAAGAGGMPLAAGQMAGNVAGVGGGMSVTLPQATGLYGQLGQAMGQMGASPLGQAMGRIAPTMQKAQMMQQMMAPRQGMPQPTAPMPRGMPASPPLTQGLSPVAIARAGRMGLR